MSADHIIVNKEPVPALTEQLVKSNVTSPHMGASIRDLELPWWLRQERLPAMQETQLYPRVRKIPWRMEMATHSSILAWEIPWTKEPG